MPDTEEQFREKDRAYFDLLGRTVAVGNRVGTITEYRPVAGPEYWFTIHFWQADQIVVPRDRFFVLPSIRELRNVIATAPTDTVAVQEFVDPEDIDVIASAVDTLVRKDRL